MAVEILVALLLGIPIVLVKMYFSEKKYYLLLLIATFVCIFLVWDFFLEGILTKDNIIYCHIGYFTLCLGDYIIPKIEKRRKNKVDKKI